MLDMSPNRSILHIILSYGNLKLKDAISSQQLFFNSNLESLLVF
jgi:hypothetical protein